MNNAWLTVSDLFSFGVTQLSDERLDGIESAGEMPAFKDAIASKIGAPKWPLAMKEIVREVEATLQQVSIPDIMVGAWEKYGSIMMHLKKSKDSPEETFLLPLKQHEIHSEHNPYIEILFNDQALGKVNFQVAFLLVLNGLVLKIRNGKIFEVLTGSCEGEGTISCENVVIFEKKLEPIQMPGSIVFQEDANLS